MWETAENVLNVSKSSKEGFILVHISPVQTVVSMEQAFN
jgi:hypothetical protein